MSKAESREITLSPEDFQLSDNGELMVHSDRVGEALRLARPDEGDPALRAEVEVTVSVKVKF